VLDPGNQGIAVMPFETSSRPNCAAAEEKVARLSAFIAADLDTRTQHGLQAAGCYLLIARSMGSPVAQALRANANRLAAANVSVRVVFCEVSPVDAKSAAFGFPGECRLAKDVRLLDAHEQLVLAPDRAWIGDCMRREPTKRDTYERFAENSADVAAYAMRSFEHLWRQSTPIGSLPQMSAAFASHLPGIAGMPATGPESFRRQ
jgi:hypothetical protein